MRYSTYGHKISGENIFIFESDNLDEARWHMNDVAGDEEYDSALLVYTNSSALLGFTSFERGKGKVKVINYLEERKHE